METPSVIISILKTSPAKLACIIKYIKNRCVEDMEFKERDKEYIRKSQKQRYDNDPIFRQAKQERMREYARVRRLENKNAVNS
jgi:hypothetical protein